MNRPTKDLPLALLIFQSKLKQKTVNAKTLYATI